MRERYSDKPCANECGRMAAIASKRGLCPECSEETRKRVWREKNPTFKDLVEMTDDQLAAAWLRLLEARRERASGG